VKPAKVKKTVLISQSQDIFTNLALEDYLYKNEKFSDKVMLLLWRNTPCVVIGRHQNPWIEANLEFLSHHRIPVARRNSGGGTVYHDLGNLNCSFFGLRADYDRKENLAMISRALWETYGMNLKINDRDDLIWKDAKLSGTAAKLGRDTAYHHCTLLVDSDRNVLHQSLHTNKTGYESKATSSVPATIACLKDAEPSVRLGDVMSAIGRVFLDTPVVNKKNERVQTESGGYQMVNPSDYWFPGKYSSYIYCYSS
jgi:lipoyltransferase 1